MPNYAQNRIFFAYFHVMENAQQDYQKLYQETLLILSEKEELLVCKQVALTEKEDALVEKDLVITDLKFELDKLRKAIFGSKSEKRNNSVGVDQLGLFELGTTKAMQEELSQQAASTAKPAPKKRAKGTGRMSLPQELPREEVVIQPSESTEGCVKIGEEITEVLEIVPA